MLPEVKIIADSVSPAAIRLTTFHLRYWRSIHAELMTHRVFSRNGRSSRAVPNGVLLREPIVEPMRYGANRKGMSAGEELRGWRRLLARLTWVGMARMTRVGVRVLHFAGLHKQWSNRPLEWFGCIDVLVTATDFQNWFALRIDDGAQPEIRALAIRMRDQLLISRPRQLRPGEWHLPYISNREREQYAIAKLLRLSTARCARLSYEPFDGNADHLSEFARYERLVIAKPVHASPAEHQATPDAYDGRNWEHPELHGNLRGWIQHRKQIAGEFVPG